MNCAETKLNLEAYALGALDPQTHARVERHLLECDACRRAALQYAIVAHTLPDALSKRTAHVPPASLKRNLMAAVQADQRARAGAPARRPRSLTTPSPFAPRGLALPKPRTLLPALAGATFLIGILITGLIYSQLQMQQTLSDVQTPHAETLDAIAPEVWMLSPDPTSNAYASITNDPVRKMFVIRAFGLPPLSEDKEYVIWTTTGGVTQSVGSFRPLADGSAHLSFLPMQNLNYPNSDSSTAVAYLSAQNPPILKRVLITRQFTNNPLISNDHVLVWRANPNEEVEDFKYNLPVIPFLRSKYIPITPRDIMCDILPLDDPRCSDD